MSVTHLCTHLRLVSRYGGAQWECQDCLRVHEFPVEPYEAHRAETGHGVSASVDGTWRCQGCSAKGTHNVG